MSRPDSWGLLRLPRKLAWGLWEGVLSMILLERGVFHALKTGLKTAALNIISHTFGET